MKKTDMIKITNRDSGRVGYDIDELGIKRRFAPRETKEISFEELEKLSFLSGGLTLIKNYLIVKNEEAIKELGIKVEPEYFYNEEDIKNILLKGSMNEFLDCLDFAPDGVIDMLKKMAVSLPLNDVAKRDAILEKTGFNVTRAIEINNTKNDGDDSLKEQKNETTIRRSEGSIEPVRRAPSKYKVVVKED